MNYRKIYKNLIESRKMRNISDAIYEKHHIIPRCMGGNNNIDNLVNLTPEEHFIAHQLLVKIYPTNHSLIYAANMMSNRVKNNKEYGWIKRKFIKIEKINKTGNKRTIESIQKQKNTIKNKIISGEWFDNRIFVPLSKEHKMKISKANLGKVILDKSKSNLQGYILRYGKEDGLIKFKRDSAKKDSCSQKAFIKKYGEEDGLIKFEEYRSAQSMNATGENNPFYGKHHTIESKKKMSKSKLGKSVVRTKEHNTKIGLANKGKKQETTTCQYCKKLASIQNINRWHNSNCKLKP